MDHAPRTPRPRTTFGWESGSSPYGPRGLLGAPERSITGNVILRAGNEVGSDGWQQSVHIVLTRTEARELIEALQAQAQVDRG